MKPGKPELLAPAGNFEKLEMAIHFGADAVYLANKDYSLRNFSGNFSIDELKHAVIYAHRQAVKVYVAVNIYPRNHELPGIEAYLKVLDEIAPDGIIVADPGIFNRARHLIPHIPIHLSTQANTTNLASATFWEQLGAKRINVARELPLREIKEIAVGTELDIEAFVHGAMCISYSGRCLLSNFLTQRDANRGMCSHPCRWGYTLMEEYRPGEYMPLLEDERGSYIFNSKDLCMIEHIPEMISAGIRSFKIEGRMKGINYLASTLKVYREALDAYAADPLNYKFEPRWREELSHVNYRGYCTGFYFNDPGQLLADLERKKGCEEHRFIAKILQRIAPGQHLVEVRNKLHVGDVVEVLTTHGPLREDTILDLRDEAHAELHLAQPGSIVRLATTGSYATNDLIRNTEVLGTVKDK